MNLPGGIASVFASSLLVLSPFSNSNKYTNNYIVLFRYNYACFSTTTTTKQQQQQKKKYNYACANLTNNYFKKEKKIAFKFFISI